MNDQHAPPAPVHEPGTTRGEELVQKRGKEPGRIDSGTTEDGRPVSKSTPRFSTGINASARKSIVPNTPFLPPP